MRLSDEELIQLVKARYNRPQSPVEYEALAQEFHHDKSVIFRAVKEAFRRRLVEVREVESDPVTRIPDLEQRLQEAFNLLGAIVLDCADSAASSMGVKEPTAGDKVHAKLGRAMACLIGTGAVFRDGDCVGLGSGRGVYYTVEALAKLPGRLRASNITIISLTGDVHAQDHAKIIDSKMDADAHTILFSVAFVGKVKRCAMGARILYSDEAILESVRSRTWSDPEWPKLTHALVGVGSLTTGHRFYDDIKAGHPEPILAPIHSELSELVHLCEEASRSHDGFYCPVGDISNNLFYVRPPAGVKVTDRTEQRIRKLIISINPRLLNIPEATLKQTATVLLVAGTRKKALAIRELLTSDSHRIRFLSTDRVAAEIILREVQG